MTTTTHHSTRFFAFAAAAVFFTAACGPGVRPPAPAAGAGVRVAGAYVQAVDVPAGAEAGGIVRARLTADVSSRVLSPVVAVRVRPGDRVRAGEPLVELDARQLDADRRRTAAALTAAERTARAAEADVTGAEAVARNARATRDRVVSLFERRSATAAERDDVETAVAEADARVDAARARAAEAVSAIDAARAAGEAASVAASYAVLVAPFDGIVSERRTDPGQTAVPGTPLVTIESADALQLHLNVDETRAARLARGQTIPVLLDAAAVGDRESAVPARVVEVGRVDAASHSLLVKLELPRLPGLRTGQFGRAVVDGPPRPGLTVPSGAIVRRGQLTFVFTAANGVARLRPVSLGRERGEDVVVTAGLLAGDLVITNAPESLLDGASVAVTVPGSRR